MKLLDESCQDAGSPPVSQQVERRGGLQVPIRRVRGVSWPYERMVVGPACGTVSWSAQIADEGSTIIQHEFPDAVRHFYQRTGVDEDVLALSRRDLRHRRRQRL